MSKNTSTLALVFILGIALGLAGGRFWSEKELTLVNAQRQATEQELVLLKSQSPLSAPNYLAAGVAPAAGNVTAPQAGGAPSTGENIPSLQPAAGQKELTGIITDIEKNTLTVEMARVSSAPPEIKKINIDGNTKIFRRVRKSQEAILQDLATASKHLDEQTSAQPGIAPQVTDLPPDLFEKVVADRSALNVFASVTITGENVLEKTFTALTIEVGDTAAPIISTPPSPSSQTASKVGAAAPIISTPPPSSRTAPK